MPSSATSSKNFSLSVMDLGLGDQLAQQVEDEEAERRKKLLQASDVSAFSSPAVQSIYGAQPGGPRV